jgi:hypothetical protein
MEKFSFVRRPSPERGWTGRIKGSRDVIETTVWYLRRLRELERP